MALVKTGTFGSSPQAYYELYAEQLSGSSTSRTIKLTLGIKVSGSSSSRYGYPLNWLPLIHSSNAGWKKLKGNETWYGSDGLRWVDAQLTVDVGTTSSTSISVGFQLDMTQGSSSWETTQTASFVVGSTNTPPKMNGSITIRKDSSSGEVLSGIIPENISTIYLSWQQGSDNEQGSNGLRYGVNEIIDGGGATTILFPTTGLSHIISIGSGNEGQRRKYYVDCRDNSDALSANRADSVELTKNSFTGDTLASNSTIGFTTESVDFTLSGAKNTNGNTSFTRTLTCDGVTVYNNSGTATSWSVVIYRNGVIPDKAYIKFEDIKNKFKDSSYVGALNFTIRTTNEYGTTKTNSKSISVDLRTTPNPAKNQEISKKTTESTAYKKVGFSNSYYFLPDGSAVVRVQWTDGSGKLEEVVSYEVFVAYGSNSLVKVADRPATGGYNYYDHIIPKQTITQQFKYLIRCKTSYGYYSDAETSIETLHYYNSPSISIGEIERTETTASIPVTVSTSSSILGIETVGAWSGKGDGKLTTSQKEQRISVGGLAGNETYTISITYNDNTGFSANQVRKVSIGANLPIMFLNKYGLGLGGIKADSNHSLRVFGKTEVTEAIVKKSKSSSWVSGAKGEGVAIDMPDNTGYNSIIRQKCADGVWNFGTYQDGNYLLTYFKDTTVNAGTNASDGQIIFPKNVKGTVYTTGNKPTASDVGARPSNWMPTASDVGAIQKNVDTSTNGRLEVVKGVTIGAGSLNDLQGDGTPWYGMAKTGGSSPWVKYSGYFGAELRSASQRVSVEPNSTGVMIANDYGYARIGCKNAGFFHFETDRDNFYFNKTVRVSGDVTWGSSYNNNYTHGTNWKIQGFDNANSSYLHCATSAGAFGINWWASDVRLKNNIAELTGNTDYTETLDKDKLNQKRQYGAFSALDTIKKIGHFSFNMLSSDSHTSCGYIANQLQEVDDEFVMEVKQDPTVKKYDEETEEIIEVSNPMYFEEDPVIRNPKPSALIPYITKAIQEQQEIIEKLIKRIEELEAK